MNLANIQYSVLGVLCSMGFLSCGIWGCHKKCKNRRENVDLEKNIRDKKKTGMVEVIRISWLKETEIEPTASTSERVDVRPCDPKPKYQKLKFPAPACMLWRRGQDPMSSPTIPQPSWPVSEQVSSIEQLNGKWKFRKSWDNPIWIMYRCMEVAQERQGWWGWVKNLNRNNPGH